MRTGQRLLRANSLGISPAWLIPGLRHPVARTAASFLIVTITYAIYATCLVPLMEPAATTEAPQHDAPPAPLAIMPRYRPIFDDNAWEKTARFSMQTPHALVLARDLEQVGTQQLRINPCTLIWDAAPKDPASMLVVLQAAEGAELTFDPSSDLQMGVVGEITTADLRGPVHVQRMRLSDRVPEVDVQSSNVHMDTTRIWTADDVEFRWRGSHGQGRGMVINLYDPRLLADIPSDAPAISRIKSLELDHLAGLHIELPPQASPDEKNPRPHWLDVRCRGRMSIDFEQRVATLDQDVTVFHHGDHEAAEQLSCDTLSLYFDSVEPADSADAVAPKSPTLPKMILRQLVAVGNPVIADMPSQSAWARCDKLVYFPEDRQVVLESQSTTPVEVKHGDKHLRFQRRLEYSWLLSGTRPRALRIDGPGEFHGSLSAQAAPTAARVAPPNQFVTHRVATHSPAITSSDNRSSLAATWSHGLTLMRQENQLRLTLNADAPAGSAIPPVVISGHTLGELQSQQVMIDLEERPTAGHAGRSPSRNPMAGIVPIGFATRRQTTLQSPQLDLRCEDLDGTFLHAKPQTNLASAIAAEPMDLGPNAPQGTTEPPSPGGPRLASATGDLPPPAPQPRSPQRMDRWSVLGNHVQLQFEPDQGRWRPGSAMIEGAVDVQHWPHNPQQAKLQFRGEQLTLQQPQEPNGFIHLLGHPARIDWGDATLQAEQAHVHSGTGEINIPCPGQAWLPADPDSPLLQEPVEISWGGNMHFLGKVALFRGGTTGVIAQTQNQLRRLRTDQCELTLTQAIKPPLRGAPHARVPRVEIEKLRLMGNVYVESHTMEQQQRTAIDIARLPDFELDQRTGNFFSNGPGSVSHTGLQSGGSPFQLTSGKLPTATAPRLTYARVDYQRRLQGNLRDVRATFQGNVDVVQGPIQSWGDVLDRDRAGGLGPEGVWMTCQILDVIQAPGSSKSAPTWELEATDNVRVEGQEMTAEGDRLTYSQVKDRLQLAGSARRDAILTQRDPKTGALRTTRQRQLNYSPSTQDADGQFKEIDFGVIPGMSLKDKLP